MTTNVSIENLKVKAREEGKNKGVFEFEPLPTGYGYTIGNALRRVLLTSIKGAAITQIKVAGANHQFSTLAGVKEDLVEVTMNLKQVRLQLHGENPVVVSLKKKGPGKVTAGDIEETSDLKVMNKEQHIATLADSKTQFDIELVVEPGVGYSPMEERQTSKVGVIVIDALFSPVLLAKFEVEPTRFADRTDLDKVVLEVETDGSISPKESIKAAAGVLKKYYQAVSQWVNLEDIEEEKEEELSELPAKSNEEDIAIEELPLQTRTINSLKKSKITTLAQLGKMSDEEIADVKNLGEKSLSEIKDLLQKEG